LKHITWEEFEQVDIRSGTIIDALEFPEARKPAYKLRIDFGNGIGILKSSAQITALYTPNDLIGKQIIAVVNFPPKQIGPWLSECLVLGLAGSAGIVLLRPDNPVPNGQKMH
jgi:tRNA-binding protein